MRKSKSRRRRSAPTRHSRSRPRKRWINGARHPRARITAMRIAYITSGAAGMFCGSCMRDNTLAAELIAQGHDALLIPTYTPVRTDEDDVSQKRVFFGGVNVYLQEKFSLFRHTPRWFDRLLDANWLLNWVSRFAVSTQAQQLGDLTISMLQGEHGH